MSQEPRDPTPPAPQPAPPAPGTPGGPTPRRSATIVRVLSVLAVLGIVGLVLWAVVGEELYEQVKEYQLAVEDRDLSAPVGYLGLYYRKEYNARPPRFHFEEDGKKLLWASVGDGETPDFYDVTEAQFDPQILKGGFGRDSIPGVDYPILQEPDGEVARNLGDRNEVAGVVLDSGPRAYPLGVLQKVEIINDTDGEVPITIVYARGSDTVQIYRREVDGQPISLGTTGYATHEEVPLFYDRKSKGLWLPDSDGGALICVNGQYAGVRLPEYRESERLTWGQWRRQHPETQVLVGNDRSRPIPEE